jgi:hypothetical protein
MCAAGATMAQVTRYLVNKHPYQIPDDVVTPDESSEVLEKEEYRV